jgi:small subunit ribosomal protein S9
MIKTKKSSSNLLSGKYYYGIGRRKTACAKVRMYDGKGNVYINNKKITSTQLENYTQPLIKTNQAKKFDLSIYLTGGGKSSSQDATSLGIARALIKYDKNFRQVLKKHGFLRRDPRQVERKKPGLKKARRAPQWKKR